LLSVECVLYLWQCAGIQACTHIPLYIYIYIHIYMYICIYICVYIYVYIYVDGITIEEAIPIVQLCRVKKDKRVYGVLGSANRKTNNKNRLIVNSVGEGAICICNTNGNIENGDYICSSELLGFGEKQDDDLLHNYSVAKAVMDCNFELDSPYYQCYELEGGVRVAFIACTYHCG